MRRLLCRVRARECQKTQKVTGSTIISNPAADATLLVLDSPASGVNVNFGFEVGDTGISGLHPKNLVIRGSSGASDIAFSPSTTYPGLMMLDGSTGKVGIGTTNPSSRLDVNGIGTFNQVRIGDSTTTNYGLIVNYADTRLLQLKEVEIQHLEL